MKINWKQKLSSRKLWAAVAGFVAALLFAFGVESGVESPSIEQVAAVIAAIGTLVAYILTEGKVDAAREQGASGVAQATDAVQTEQKEVGECETPSPKAQAIGFETEE